MNSAECYQQRLDVIRAIPDDRIKTPNSMPVKVYTQEAENLHSWATDDKDQLIAKGLDWGPVADLPIRCGALKEASARWAEERFTREEAAKQWAIESPLAYELRNELIQEFRFAFRKDTKLSSKVSTIAEGSGHADMLQDLNDLAVLGRAHTDLLAKTNFDMTLLDQAAQKSFDLAALLADATGERADSSETKRIRDQAYTYVKEVVDEVYAIGQFVFRDNERRLKGYHSNFLRQVRIKKAQPAPTDGTSTPPTQTTQPSAANGK